MSDSFDGTLVEPKVISWDEVFKHARPDDCWVVINRKVYDITAFVPHHPGGKALWWQGGGRDITILFNISHPPYVTVESHVEKVGKFIGVVDRAEVEGAPEYDFNSALWCELKEKCWKKLNDLVRHKPGYKEGKFASVAYDEPDVMLFHIILIALYVASLMFLIGTPFFRRGPYVFDTIEVLRLCVAFWITPPLAMCLSLTMHEARHRATGLAWYLPLDLSSISSYRYMHEHTWHHIWPNLPDDQIEVDVFASAPGLRHFPWQVHHSWHRAQWLYWPLSLMLVFPRFLIRDLLWVRGKVGKLRRGWWSWEECALFFAGKLIHPVVLPIPVLLKHSCTENSCALEVIVQFIFFLVVLLATSFCISAINVISHLDAKELSEAKKQYADFAKTQIVHSVTYEENSTFWLWLTQGINTQIEHHCFPTVPFKYLPYLSPIIKDVSRKHNVHIEERYMSASELCQSYLERLFLLSKPGTKCVGGYDKAYINGDKVD
eukprot:TRINITY_DN31016_c0_g1_i1.p1 TRINITY_DN31016_c0_g1~~TRINITY_DN31016_c0_g1_i1.p1  ORF type:complete len:490 (+),score=42.99 TRINITY_DN31016_c0_g1_i1:57-1526(+)